MKTIIPASAWLRLGMLYIMSALLLCSCAEAPHQQIKVLSRARVEAFIVKGKTTKTQILREFGWPSSTTTQSMAIPGVNPNMLPYETMVYSKIYMVGEVAVLMVQLDKNEIVMGYTFSNTGVLTEGVKPISVH